MKNIKPIEDNEYVYEKHYKKTKSEKQTLINDLQKYPIYSVPSKKYLHSLSLEELKEVKNSLRDIYKK